jgi:hypothetical protein
MKPAVLGAAALSCFSLLLASCTSSRPADSPGKEFDPATDLLSLHYDHAPDRDDGHSAAADRTILESEFGVEWLHRHVVAVSGAYGRNAGQFVDASDAVMDAAWNDAGGWLDGHEDPPGTRSALATTWQRTLTAGGDVWVKEGGQSDITADVVRRVSDALPDVDTRMRIHVVQHSDWNENQSSPDALAFVRDHTDYIRISDANAFLNAEGGDNEFVTAAVQNERFGAVWRAAFDYYDPSIRLDFSDTGELMYILSLGTPGFRQFQISYLQK